MDEKQKAVTILSASSLAANNSIMPFSKAIYIQNVGMTVVVLIK
jgi:hypothetical protein